MDEPVLNPKKEGPSLSWGRAVFTTIKCNWGVGMMAMPYFLDQSGLWAGSALFVLAMFLAYASIIRLSDCRRIIQARLQCAEEPLLSARETPEIVNYSDIISHGLGVWGGRVSVISILIAMYGSNIAYLVFIKENLATFVSDFDTAGDTEGWQWVLMALVPLLILVTVSDLRFLGDLSACGLVFAVSFEGLLLYKATQQLHLSRFREIMRAAPAVRVETLPIGIGIASFCNE
eukprot:gene21948-26434_t